jgi:hypothetical protein
MNSKALRNDAGADASLLLRLTWMTLQTEDERRIKAARAAEVGSEDSAAHAAIGGCA